MTGLNRDGGACDMPRRVVVISDLSEARDGPSVIALKNAKALAESGVAVAYFCGDSGQNQDLIDMGIEIHPIGDSDLRSTSIANAAVRGLYNAAAARKLKSLIKNHDTPETLYHVHNWSKILSPSIFSVLRLVMERVILSAHDYFLACPNGGYFNFRKGVPCTLVPHSASCIFSDCDRRSRAEKVWRIFRDLERRLFMDLSRSPGTVLAVHEGMVGLLTRGGISKDSIKVLRNVVEPWSDERVEAETNSEFIFVGRLEHDKGVLLLAEAARNANVPVTFVGDGALAGEISAIYPGARLVGFKDRQGLKQVASKARCLVVPTRSRETFSLVAYEAITSGIPVVISDFAATRDDLLAEGVGIACNPYDTAALTQALTNLAVDDAKIAKMSLSGFQGRDGMFLSQEKWRQQLFDLYRVQMRKANAGGHPLAR